MSNIGGLRNLAMNLKIEAPEKRDHKLIGLCVAFALGFLLGWLAFGWKP